MPNLPTSAIPPLSKAVCCPPRLPAATSWELRLFSGCQPLSGVHVPSLHPYGQLKSHTASQRLADHETVHETPSAVIPGLPHVASLCSINKRIFSLW